MKLGPAAIAIVLGIAFGCSAPKVAKEPPVSKMNPSSDNPYSRMRSQALSVRRDEIGIPDPRDATKPWGVIMESGLEGGTMTLVAFADGTASIYLSNGTVMVGGGEHENIRKVAQALVATAGKLGSEMKKTTDFPAPAKGQSTFYLRTDGGVLTASASEGEMLKGGHVLSPLFRAAQDVITQYRLTVTSRH